MTEIPMRKEGKNCEHCGNAFARPNNRSHKQWDEMRFCSRPCRDRTTRRISDPLMRFEENYIPEPNSGCWLWTGTEMNDGYGHIMVNGKLWRAHKLSYVLFRGKDGRDKDVLHSCDNRLCVNPDHLRIGTHAENMRDMKDRGRSLKGEKHHQSKLTEKDIIEIRASNGTFTDIGRKFGVSRVMIRNIIHRRAWSHVP